MTVSIVMLVGPDRYRLTQQAFTTLTQHTDPESYTLTLVCDELDFRTTALVGKMLSVDPMFSGGRQFPDISALHVENSNHTISQLKNIGVAWSEQRWGRGDWLYISDSDVAFTPGWLEKLTHNALASEPDEYRLWGGQIHPFHQPRTDNGWFEYYVLDGPSWFMRWETWDICGPLPRTTAPGVCQSEEYGFCQDLIGRGWRIGVVQPHCVHHVGLTHLNGHDCIGRKERELMIPKGVLAE